MSWKFTRKLMPVRFEADEPICMIVPQRRAELEEFAPEIRRIESDEDLQRKHELFLRERGAADRYETAARVAAGQQPSGTATIREAHTETARPGHQIIRLAAIFVHLLSHNMTRSNRTAGVGLDFRQVSRGRGARVYLTERARVTAC